MRVALDAMGGDYAPQEIVRGAADGLQYLSGDDQIVLYGFEDQLRAQCAEIELDDARVRIEHCSQAIPMEAPPVEALRQNRDSSILRMVNDAGKRELDVIISAGNTGAFAAACQLKIKPVEGIARPGIAVALPTFHGPVLVCDVGANVAPKPRHLFDYARMCRVYAETILKQKNPRIGMVSIGEEAGKGNQLVKEATSLIRSDPGLHFIGNVEGRDIFSGAGEIFICDGFVGNVILKLTEGLSEGIFKTIVHEIEEEGAGLAQQFKPVVDRIWKRHDFAEYGGAPLLGIKCLAIICHGRSDRRAIANAIRTASVEYHANLNAMIAERVSQAGEVPA